MPDPDPVRGVVDVATHSLTPETQRVLCLDFKNSDTKTRRTAVDKRLIELEQHMSALKTYQNGFTPTCRLPREILSRIFLTVAFLCHEESSTALHRRWVRVSHVCRYWRAVALDCRELWSAITFEKYDFTDLCLARSRDSPLTVFIRELPYEDNASRGQWGIKLKNVLSQTDRLVYLDVKTQRSGTGWYGHESRADLKTLFSYFNGIPKKLQWVSLDCSNCHWEDVLPDEVLFKESAPALTHLSLTKTIFKWKVPELHALRHLHVTETQPQWSGPSNDKRPSVEAFCAAIQQMLHLEVLELVNAFADVTRGEQHKVTLPVKLPSTLRNLRLTSSAAKLKQFFSPILVPKVAWIDLKFTDTNLSRPSHVDECLAALSNAWREEEEESPRRQLSALSIIDVNKSSKSPRFECSFYLPPIEVPGIPHSVCYGSRLGIEFVTNAVLIRDIFKTIDKHLCLSTAHYFTVDNTWSLSSAVYAEMLQAMPSLLVINLRKTWMKHLLDAMASDPALQPTQGTPAGAVKPKPYCPALDVLHFHLTDFNEHDEADPQALARILKLIEIRANDHGPRRLFVTVATNFDNPDATNVVECFQRLGLPGMELMWDGSVHIRKLPVKEAKNENTDEDENEEEGKSEEEEEEEESEEEEEYECTAEDLEIDDDCFY